MSYDFRSIEKKWQDHWEKHQTFKAVNHSEKPKYYVLDMFPYPSGAGLHVGHPLGYIASDIYARYKRHKGFNVLHPQGYDSFGLPAEQYAIQTGQHPAITTTTNIETYRKQLDQIGFSFDWSREVRTSDPKYYKWTQWIFTELFNSWYHKTTDKAEPISNLIKLFSSEGNTNVNAHCDEDVPLFSAKEWAAFSENTQQQILLKYRLTYLANTEVNWCPALGTVLANDEIVNGTSERGGHPVIRKKMTQWSMRISAYAERLLQGLNTIDWTDSLKESQRNWIGKSVGASVSFKVVSAAAQSNPYSIEVFTTRPDTLFGASFITLAPEHELVTKITSQNQSKAVNAYIEATAKRSERDRMADVKTISGVFTGAYAEHPFTKQAIPIWIGDYVLANYGTGAVMAVPCGDQRDYDFAKHFNIDIPNIFEGPDISQTAYSDKTGFTLTNSDFLNGMTYKKAVKRVVHELEHINQGQGKTNYRLRDAVFSRQRYWGEPFPVYYVNGMPQMIAKEHLPIKLPDVEKYLPTETGDPPLARANTWAWDTKAHAVVHKDNINNTSVYPLELNTMPGWAGSSWYFFRYMEDCTHNEAFASNEALNYWKNVDLYIGGNEHATGHLLYSRFWVKFLNDRAFVPVDEPFKKLINQGMILGTSAIVYRLHYTASNSNHSSRVYVSFSKLKNLALGTDQNHVCKAKQPNVFYELESYLKQDVTDKTIDITDIQLAPLRVNVNYVNAANEIAIENLKQEHQFRDGIFITDHGVFTVNREVEKMSKRWFNVVNPDTIVANYGADSLRLYEMFLGPLEQSKPWNTAGITGVHNFLKKMWKLYVNQNQINVIDCEPTKDNLKTLHKTIKKVEEDIENFSFNTSVSTFMIAVNEFSTQQCTSKAVLEDFLILISPYAPHIAEELWLKLGHNTSISTEAFPKFDANHLVESSKNYPISFNGKMRFTLELPINMSKEAIESEVMTHQKTIAQLDGKPPKKVIVIPGKIVNIVS